MASGVGWFSRETRLVRPSRPTGPFDCFYCGEKKPAEAASKEHIVPVCIGGGGEQLITWRVCGTCNGFMSKHVDLPFGRDWVVASHRLVGKIANRGKPPVLCMGVVQWARPEQVEVHVADEGVSFYRWRTTGGDERVLVTLDPSKERHLRLARRVLKKRFSDAKVVNDASYKATPEEDDVVDALAQLGAKMSLKYTISRTAWDRALVKMALGLTCKQFGREFVVSDCAAELRRFVWEMDADKRANMGIAGVSGFLRTVEEGVSKVWRPVPGSHDLALIESNGDIRFVMVVFGQYENIVRVSADPSWAGRLPGHMIRGVLWRVEPERKQVDGPQSILARIQGVPSAVD